MTMDIQQGYLALFRYGHRGARYSRSSSYVSRFGVEIGCINLRSQRFISGRNFTYNNNQIGDKRRAIRGIF